MDSGVRYLNWCGKPDGMSSAVREMGAVRREVVFATQIKARSADEAERELDSVLTVTSSERLEVATLYYVESDAEWRAIVGPGGAWEALARRRELGEVGLIGLTSHQRATAAGWAKDASQSGRRLLDMLMVRYNAAHVGAEQDVFPVTQPLQMPVVTFTGVRWRDLLKPTPDDPPGFVPPTAPDCYRFCMAHPGVAVALAAPNGRAELLEDLAALDAPQPLDATTVAALREHGRRVHRHARKFW